MALLYRPPILQSTSKILLESIIGQDFDLV